MTNKFTFETTDAVLASAIFDLINGKPAEVKGSTKKQGEARVVEAVKTPVAEPVAAPAPAPQIVTQEATVVQAAPQEAPVEAVVAEVLTTPAAEPPVTSDQLMKVLSDFLAKFGHDAAKEVFAKHQAPPSISALVSESADKARAVFNDFSARLNA